MVEAPNESRAAILVAEDNLVNQAMIRLMLEQRGYIVEIVSNGIEALARYRPGHHGLLLSDCYMPEMDGFALTRAIRAREMPGGPRLPIVALTADTLQDAEPTCLAAGMDGVISKPIATRLLQDMLDRHLPRGQQRRPDGAMPATASPSDAWMGIAIDRHLFDPRHLDESFGADRAGGLAFLGLFLAKAPGMISSIETALAAADMSAGIGVAHALTGAARSIGAVRLGQIASDLQASFAAGDAKTARGTVGLLTPALDALVRATASLRLPASGATPTAAPIDYAKLHILLIEDEPFTRDLLGALLRGIGVASVAACEDGEAGLAELLRSRPDLVFCDMRMAGMDGREFLNQVRASAVPGVARTPVVFLTADDTAERAPAADGHLVKPVGRGQLRETIDAILASKRS
jgi:CheY-like chemotaxis protein/HPt (histidine-containing phosphotransfer) domain-containing protein